MWELIAKSVLGIIDKVIPDPAAKAAAQLEVLKLRDSADGRQLQADLQLALAQTDVNKIDAASASPFKSNWRPAVGWVCVLALCWQYLAWPLLTWLSNTRGLTPPPRLDVQDVLALLAPLLGLGAYRTIEKIKGVA